MTASNGFEGSSNQTKSLDRNSPGESGAGFENAQYLSQQVWNDLGTVAAGDTQNSFKQNADSKDKEGENTAVSKLPGVEFSNGEGEETNSFDSSGEESRPDSVEDAPHDGDNRINDGESDTTGDGESERDGEDSDAGAESEGTAGDNDELEELERSENFDPNGGGIREGSDENKDVSERKPGGKKTVQAPGNGDEESLNRNGNSEGATQSTSGNNEDSIDGETSEGSESTESEPEAGEEGAGSEASSESMSETNERAIESGENSAEGVGNQSGEASSDTNELSFGTEELYSQRDLASELGIGSRTNLNASHKPLA